MCEVKLKFFGYLSDLSEGAPPLLDANTPTQIRTKLAINFPKLASELHSPSILLAVNKVIVPWDEPLVAGDEVAFLPPVTGG
ncbi:MAG: molybdopterin synthase sulfur carrier subunit [Porticoccaceae bacterium]|nr:molybdopterin synthase sulfur carrier subunit [Porticoccaceae bacterium]|tara:strand:+ start:1188 stop:1433 length:246 start_codon:yes stop_codon:yes gene_type:complete